MERYNLGTNTLIVRIREKLIKKSILRDPREKFKRADRRAREIVFGCMKGLVSEDVLRSYLA